MKKLTFFIYPLIIGIFNGAFIECGLYLLLIKMSPFSGYEEKGAFLFCVVSAFLLALIIVVAITLDVKCLINLNSSKVKLIVIAQVCTAILISFFSCPTFEVILDCFL